MKISVIHPARNEHEEIVATVASMLHAGADEVIVIDDGSEIPIPQVPGTVHVRHESSLGPSVSRNLGARMANGDVLVFADAHTRIDALKEISQEAVTRQCIMVPAMQALYGDGKTTGYSRNFILKGDGNQLIGFDKVNQRPTNRFTRLAGNWGGFFVMPRTVYERIGGWVEHRYWGYNDPSLILKAWFCDVPVILDRDTIYKHKGKVKTGFGYPVKALHPLINLWHTYTVLFDHRTVTQHWEPLMTKHHSWAMPTAYALARLQYDERDKFHGLKVKSDIDFFDLFLPAKGYNGFPANPMPTITQDQPRLPAVTTK